MKVSLWLDSLRKETLFAWWTILSAISTASTFIPHLLPPFIRPVFVISLIVAFGWANYRVFGKQQSEIERLQRILDAKAEHVSDLVIDVDPASMYILHPVGNIPKADFTGAHVELRLMIENKGQRRSTIDGYQIELPDLHKTYTDLPAVENCSYVGGRHSGQGLNPQQILSKTGLIHIEPESTTTHGTLLFVLPDLTLTDFADAHMKMNADRRFGILKCKLTLTDRTGSSAWAMFDLREA